MSIHSRWDTRPARTRWRCWQAIRAFSKIDGRAIALVGIAGPYDLPLDDSEVEPVFADVGGPAQGRPPSLVTPAHPPTLLLHGRENERVLRQHTERYAAALRRGLSTRRGPDAGDGTIEVALTNRVGT